MIQGDHLRLATLTKIAIPCTLVQTRTLPVTAIIIGSKFQPISLRDKFYFIYFISFENIVHPRTNQDPTGYCT